MASSFAMRKLNIRLVSTTAALLAGVLMMLAPTDGQAAGNGGLGVPDPPSNSNSANTQAARFGNRVLKEGMAGPDVKILKSIVRAQALLSGSPLNEDFDSPTTAAVKRFQKKSKVKRNGVVNKKTAKHLVRSMKKSGASWYGPGFWGNKTACGQTLKRKTIGVAHKKLPCGTKVMIGYKGRYMAAKVIDRGPFSPTREWDLTLALSDALKFTPVGVDQVRSVVVKNKK